MPEYLVTWRVELDATDPLDAARQALEMQRDPTSLATVFVVTCTDHIQEIDLSIMDGVGLDDEEELQ